MKRAKLISTNASENWKMQTLIFRDVEEARNFNLYLGADLLILTTGQRLIVGTPEWYIFANQNGINP